MALHPGTCVGTYEITSEIGAGGEMYRATDTNLRRQVVIKVLPPLGGFIGWPAHARTCGLGWLSSETG